jgi:hypothetical protein
MTGCTPRKRATAGALARACAVLDACERNSSEDEIAAAVRLWKAWRARQNK